MHMKRWLLATVLAVAVSPPPPASSVGRARRPLRLASARRASRRGRCDRGAAPSDDDAPLTGEPRDRAVAAAVTHVGGGEVTGTELDDGGAAYGVEVRKPDGTQVEVNLDQGYAVPHTEADDDGPGDDDGPDDDTDDVNDDDGPNDLDDDPGEPPSDDD